MTDEQWELAWWPPISGDPFDARLSVSGFFSFKGDGACVPYRPNSGSIELYMQRCWLCDCYLYYTKEAAMLDTLGLCIDCKESLR